MNKNFNTYNYYFKNVNNESNKLWRLSNYDDTIRVLDTIMNYLNEINLQFNESTLKIKIFYLRELYRDVEDQLRFCKKSKFDDKWYTLRTKIEEVISTFLYELERLF